jgi:hypothetical protein
MTLRVRAKSGEYFVVENPIQAKSPFALSKLTIGINVKDLPQFENLLRFDHPVRGRFRRVVVIDLHPAAVVYDLLKIRVRLWKVNRISLETIHRI